MGNLQILSFETSSSICSVALDNKSVVSQLSEQSANRHTEVVLGFAQKLLDEAGLRLSDVSAVSWSAGPGSFTGLRVGASVVQSLGFALKIPVINVSTLQALAQEAYILHGIDDVFVAMDARMSEIYCGYYKLGSNNLMQPEIDDYLVSVEKLSIPNCKTYIAGNALSEYEENICIPSNIVGKFDDIFPTARAVSAIAKYKFYKNETCDPIKAIPNYIRNKVV